MIDAHGTLYVDNTLLASTICSTKALLRHHLGYTVDDERIHTNCGKAAHEALAVYFRSGDAEAAMAEYANQYGEFARQNVSQDFRLNFDNTSDILYAWMDDHPIAELPFTVKPELVEVGFQVPLVDECALCGFPASARCHKPDPTQPPWHEYRPAFVFYGRMDAIVEGKQDHLLHVADHKTTGRISHDYMAAFRDDSQLSGYVWAAQQTLNKPVAGLWINAIEFSMLPRDLDRKCTKHSGPGGDVRYGECRLLHARHDLQPYTRTPKQLDEWRKTALHLARKYRELTRTHPTLEHLPYARTQGKFYKECRWCPFNDFCNAGRPIEFAPGVLVHDPWRPF